MKLPKKIIIFTLCLVMLLITAGRLVYAQVSPTPTPTSAPSDNSSAVSDLQNKIKSLQDKVTELQGTEKSLSSEINTMDSKIAITQYRINLTQQQITDVEMDIDTTAKKITNLEGSLSNLTKVLLSRIVATYEIGSTQPLTILATSNTVSDFFTRANYMRIAQQHDKELIYETEQAKNDYANQQAILEDKKKKILVLQQSLQDYTKELDSEKAQKKTLLAQTQGNEANYAKLLAQAKAQLAGFQNFVRVQGGASLLSGQTDCSDAWGCYYNQRDSSWGNIGINNTSYSIAEDGCLMTSMAMVLSHYGHKATPLDINAPGNFFSSTAYLLYTVSAGGVTAQRTGTTIDSMLNDSNHDPVIVGISYDGGPVPDHFVVLVSGSGGSYMMNDPFVPNGNHISFNAHYSVGSIREIDKVVIQ